MQGAAHWLVVHRGGPGSRFVLYDKPGLRHLVHFGTVTSFEPGRYFAWRAPFSEWPRAEVGSALEVAPLSSGRSRVTETFFFEAREDHHEILAGFLRTPGYDAATMERFVATRLAGLAQLLKERRITGDELVAPFSENRIVAADWVGRVSEGGWVRVLYADGEVDFSGTQESVFNAFTRLARYADWTRDIHVGVEWLTVKAGGVGSRFLLWEKPGGRQVMHEAVITELVRGRRFTWRAPFAEWDKVFIGTSLQLAPAPGGGTRAYHVLYVDMPEEYLPVFSGFGCLHGFDIEFETFHIFEEARGFEALLRDGGFSAEHTAYLFDRDHAPAVDWPLSHGRRWPAEASTLAPERVLTFEDMLVEVSDRLASAVPSPAFLRRYRDLARIRRNAPGTGVHA